MIGLRQYVDVRLDLLQAELDRRFLVVQQSAGEATRALDQRLQSVAEAREAVSAAVAELVQRIARVETDQAQTRGRLTGYAVVFGLAGVLIAAFGFALEHLVR